MTSSRSAAPPSTPSSPPPTERPAGDKDPTHIGEHMEAFNKKVGDVKWHIDDERSLLALQGNNVPAPFMTFEAVFPQEILREVCTLPLRFATFGSMDHVSFISLL
ncbi:unnamed protein product [Urochloa humidicola]